MPTRYKKYKDKEKAREARNAERAKYYGKTVNAPNRKLPWLPNELELVMAHDVTDHELSKILGRSVAAIQIQRCRNKRKGEKENE